ncbi:hypothetical protein MMC08_000415 [Hypocenomyce scalaris]|nr:hypothetical protein [Hypocenomyce scalaris]
MQLWAETLSSPGLLASGQDCSSRSPLDALAGQLLRTSSESGFTPPPHDPYTAAAAGMASGQCTAVSAALPQQQHPAAEEKKIPGAEQTATATALLDRQHTGLPKQHHAAVLTQTPDWQQTVTAAPLLSRQDTASVHDQPSRQDTASVHDQPSRQQSMSVCGGGCRSNMQHSQSGQVALRHSSGGMKAAPLQLMLCQWGLPRKIVQVTNPTPTTSNKVMLESTGYACILSPTSP